MNKTLIFIFTTIFSAIGWWLGEKVGLMTAFILSSIGCVAGVVAGWWINQEYFE